MNVTKRKLIRFLGGIYRNFKLDLSSLQTKKDLQLEEETNLQPEHTNISFIMPDNNNTCISMLSMGNAVGSFLVERSVRTIRKSGEFSGYIMIITDEEGSIRYHETLSWDPKVIVMRVRKEDFYPINEKTGKLIEYRSTMRYKRFKTLVLKYLDYDTRVASSVRYVMYLDVDTVCSKKISPFFEDYHQFVQKEYASMNQKYTNFSYIAAYWDQGIKNTVHGGFMILDRLHSVGCLDGWRDRFDNHKSIYDQALLKDMLQAPKLYKCSVFMLDGLKGEYYSLATENNLRHNSPTFIHITNTRRAKIFPISTQDAFIRKALGIEGNETMIGNITLKEVLQSKTFEHVRPPCERVQWWNVVGKLLQSTTCKGLTSTKLLIKDRISLFDCKIFLIEILFLI